MGLTCISQQIVHNLFIYAHKSFKTILIVIHYQYNFIRFSNELIDYKSETKRLTTFKIYSIHQCVYKSHIFNIQSDKK